MATIELDIIKQRCDRLLAAEKLDLINYLAASLAPEEIRKSSKFLEPDKNEIVGLEKSTKKKLKKA